MGSRTNTNEMSVRRAEWRSGCVRMLCACLCVSLRRNHSCICCQHSISLVFLRSSVSCPDVDTLAETESDTNYLMSIFQLINCNCSAFDASAEASWRCLRSSPACMLVMIAWIWRIFRDVLGRASGSIAATDCHPLFNHSHHMHRKFLLPLLLRRSLRLSRPLQRKSTH